MAHPLQIIWDEDQMIWDGQRGNNFSKELGEKIEQKVAGTDLSACAHGFKTKNCSAS